MKLVHLIFSFFLMSLMHAQNFIIPYRIGGKFGLSDEKGKILVQPAYDNIEPLQYNYFQYTNHLVPKDTMISFTPPGQATKVYRKTGLFYKAKMILKDQVFSDYIVYPQLILGSSNPYHAENCMLFNTNGVALLPEKVKAIYVNDKRDIGSLGDASDGNSLISILQRNNTGKRLMTLAVFDHQQKKIKQYLFQKVMDYKLKTGMRSPSHIFCTYTDEKGFQEKLILYRNGKFELLDPAAIPPKDLEQYRESWVGDDNIKVEEMPPGRIDGNVAVPPDEPVKKTGVLNYVYYQMLNDSLFYGESVDYNITKKFIHLTANTELFWVNPGSNYQWGTMLIKKDNKFGFLRNGIYMDVVFDSLFYMGNVFLAFKEIKGLLQYGILDQTGNEIVPFIYDSIAPGLLEYRFDYVTNNSRMYNRIVFEPKRTYDYYGKNWPHIKKPDRFLQVFKNGKTGLMQPDGTILLPMEYEQIAANGFGFSAPKQNDFLLVKQNKLYGAMVLQYNYMKKREEVQQLIKPLLPYIPCFYINDYYNIFNVKVFGWYDLNFRFIGYTDANGFAYFKK